MLPVSMDLLGPENPSKLKTKKQPCELFALCVNWTMMTQKVKVVPRKAVTRHDVT